VGARGAGEEDGVGGQGGDVEVAGGLGFAIALDLTLDQADAGEVGPGVALGEPGEVANGPVAADLEPAMIVVDGLVGERPAVGEAAGALLGEEELEVLTQAGLVALDREQVVGALVADGLGDGFVAAQGVDGDEGALELQHLEQARDGHDLVLLAGDRLLAEHQAVRAGPGRDEMQGGAALGPVTAAPCGLAVDRNDLLLGLLLGHLFGVLPRGPRMLCAQAMKASLKAS
jgi:hypothetical protein